MPEEVPRKYLDQIQYTHEKDSIIGKILRLVSERDVVASRDTCSRFLASLGARSGDCGLWMPGNSAWAGCSAMNRPGRYHNCYYFVESSKKM